MVGRPKILQCGSLLAIVLTPLLRLTPPAVAKTAQGPGLIGATVEEWGIFFGALPVLGRLGWSWCGRAGGVGLNSKVAMDSLAKRVLLK